MPDALRCQSHAKVNLYLEVLDKREDGFNNIETIFQTVSLADTMFFEKCDNSLSMTCSNPSLETDAGNLMMKAAALLRVETGTSCGALMHLEKRIPIAGGMAGGSSNGAAALVALNRLWELGLTDEKLHTLALNLGSDVPYCIHGGTALATGRGENLVPLPPLPETWFVLVHPPIPISAGSIYTHSLLPRNAERPTERIAGLAITPACKQRLDALSGGSMEEVVFNGMETPAFHAHPELAAIKQQLLDAGCTAAAMSGSGATLFGVCANHEDAARAAAAITTYPTTVVSTVGHGVLLVD